MSRKRLNPSARSGNEKNLLRVRILDLATRLIARHIHVTAVGIVRTENVPGFPRNRFRHWKLRCAICRGTPRRRTRPGRDDSARSGLFLLRWRRSGDRGGHSPWRSKRGGRRLRRHRLHWLAFVNSALGCCLLVAPQLVSYEMRWRGYNRRGSGRDVFRGATPRRD